MRIFLALACALTFARPAPAGELIRELVPADARWLMHFDVEGLQRTALYRGALEESARMGEDPLAQMRKEMQAELGVDLIDLARSLTLYSLSPTPSEVVALVVLGEGSDALLEKLKAQPDHRSIQIEGRELHAFGEGEDAMYLHAKRFEGVRNRLYFVGDRKELVSAAVDVLDGKRASIVDRAEGGLRARPAADAFLYLETSEKLPGLDDLAPLSSVGLLAHGMRFEMAESAGSLRIELQLAAANAGDAQNIAAVLQGVSALASLLPPEQGGDELRALAGGLRFTTSGNQVEGRFAYDSLRLLQMARRFTEDQE